MAVLPERLSAMAGMPTGNTNMNHDEAQEPCNDILNYEKAILFFFVPSILEVGIFITCKKEVSCKGRKENNKQPIAIADPDPVNFING